MRCGETLLFSILGSNQIPHLWVIVTEPNPDDWLCVIVSVTTLRNNCDQTVTLRRGDHPFVTHDSAISYTDAMIVDVRSLDAEVAAGRASSNSACSADLLELVQNGLLASPFTPKKVAFFCRHKWGK